MGSFRCIHKATDLAVLSLKRQTGSKNVAMVAVIKTKGSTDSG